MQLCSALSNVTYISKHGELIIKGRKPSKAKFISIDDFLLHMVAHIISIRISLQLCMFHLIAITLAVVSNTLESCLILQFAVWQVAAS